MNRCVILSAGPVADAATLKSLLRPDDCIIAADGGWRLAQALGITPSVLVGDFDSMMIPTVPDAVQVVRLPVKKDITDTAAAAEYAYAEGAREFLFLGCTGGRLDHQHAALLTAAGLARCGCKATIADSCNRIEAVAVSPLTIEPLDGYKLSLFALGDIVKGLCVRGAAYELENYDLTPLDPLCVSNEISTDTCHISFKSGLLLVFRSKD